MNRFFPAFLLSCCFPALFHAQSPALRARCFTPSGEPLPGVEYTVKTLKDQSLEITPCKKTDNPLNGVTTYDLVLISKHILT
jgi:hypothetical protein